MPYFADFVFALIVAIGLALVLVLAFGVGRAGGVAVGTAILFVFLILFFASWAGGVWLRPFGPELWGGYILPFMFVGLIVALIVAAATAPSTGGPRRTLEGRSVPGETEPEATAVAAFGIFFWVLLLSLLIVVLLGYVLD